MGVRTTRSRALSGRRSLDAALVSPGAPTPFPVLSEKPDMKQGMSFLLCNNIWGEAGSLG